jgi:hypothetical protein
LPNEAALQELAKSVRQQIRPAAEKAMATLEKEPQNSGAFGTLLYATLIGGEAVPSVDRATVLLTSPVKGEAGPSPTRALTVAALAESGKIDGEAVRQLIEQRVEGPDAVVLLALTARRAGGDTWQKFREESADLLGEQPLPGAVVVLISRLGEAKSPLASR